MPAKSPTRLATALAAFLASVLLSVPLASPDDYYRPLRSYDRGHYRIPDRDINWRLRHEMERERDAYLRWYPYGLTPNYRYSTPAWFPGLTDPYVIERDKANESRKTWEWYEHK